MKRGIFNAANLLSFIRIPLAVIMILVYNNKPLFFTLLIIAILTDWLDGTVARKLGVTRTGAVIDPICDKLFVLTLLLFVLFTGRLGITSFLLLISRDILVGLLFIAVMFHPKKDRLKGRAKARWPGKITTVLQFTAIIWLFAGFPHLNYLIYTVLISSVIASADYLMMVKNIVE